MELEFEYDLVKSASNLEKHGLDFVTARHLWTDPDAKFGPAAERGEPRDMIYARYQERIWIAVFVMRGQRTRIISARRARPAEEKYYEQAKR